MDLGPSPKRRDVWVHPATGTYDRIPIEPSGDGEFSFKIVPVEGAVSNDGKPFRLVFVDPKTRRDDPRPRDP